MIGPRIGIEWKSTNKAVCSPAINCLYWAAGFIEGEGSFHKTHSQKGSKSEVIEVSQVEKQPLDKLQSIFGGNIRAHPQKGCFVWSVCGSRARGIMMTLYSLMSEKRKRQIKEAL